MKRCVTAVNVGTDGWHRLLQSMTLVIFHCGDPAGVQEAIKTK